MAIVRHSGDTGLLSLRARFREWLTPDNSCFLSYNYLVTKALGHTVGQAACATGPAHPIHRLLPMDLRKGNRYRRVHARSFQPSFNRAKILREEDNQEATSPTARAELASTRFNEQSKNIWEPPWTYILALSIVACGYRDEIAGCINMVSKKRCGWLT